MRKKIIFVAADRNQADTLCSVLQNHHYAARHLQSFQILERLSESEPLAAVLIDLDSVDLSNVDIRNFKRTNPNIPLLAISRKPFHPDLQESMRSHIFACVSKPIDPDELIFLLDSALENSASPIKSS
jgi:DNA-binding NtrC family response regulator